MKIVVQKEFQRYRPDGTIRVYQPGDEINLAHMSETVHELFEKGFLTLAVTDGRRKSLEMCMDATMFEAMREIQEFGHFKSTPAVLEIEEEIHRIYVAVLAGIKKLADYREAVDGWKEAVKGGTERDT